MLVTSVAANAIVVHYASVSLPLARQVSVTGTPDLIRRDQAHARSFAKQSGTSISEAFSGVNVTSAGYCYVASVGVGGLATDYSLISDTESSNPWVGANRYHARTGSCGKYLPTPKSVASRIEYIDIVSISQGNAISRQFMSVASTSPGLITLMTYTYSPETYSAKQFWGIDQSIRYGTSQASHRILDTTIGIVDTGTAFILIATSKLHHRRATDVVFDSPTGVLRITPVQFANLKSLFFNLGNRTFELTANAQISPRALNEVIGGKPGCIYLIVNDIRSTTRQGFDFVNGCTFLELFYSVFDTGAHRVGLAATPFTMAEIN
ncbi:hypothetical protein BJV74DRAFT_878436 [Russula compacta]|nr:hypothetical protein BJV74DRAFT_878436 [Russula compacta]